MPTVLFWGTGALAAAVQCLKYLGTRLARDTVLRVGYV